MSESKASFTQLLLAGVLSGGFMAAIFGFLAQEYVTTVEEQIRSDFQRELDVFRSNRSWKEQSLSELMGPINMQLRRTKLAFLRWDDLNLYLEAKIMKEGNETVRNLLLAKGHLIPGSLMKCASRLIEHYDAWLEKFEKKRASENPDLSTKFIFVGPDGYPFPSECDDAFRSKFDEFRNELYSEG